MTLKEQIMEIIGKKVDSSDVEGTIESLAESIIETVVEFASQIPFNK